MTDSPLIADTAESLMNESDGFARWHRMVKAMEVCGLDVLNYAYLDTNFDNDMNIHGVVAQSTMPQNFITYFSEQNYASTDAMARYLLRGGVQPVLYDVQSQVSDRRHAEDVMEAGLRGGLFIPLPGAATGTTASIAGITLGSGLSSDESHRIIKERGKELILLAHLFHTLAAGDYLADRLGLQKLTVRERDCLSWTAKGQRVSMIAHRLGLADITVTKHLASARKKLGAKNLPEAVARGLLLRQIHLA
ncbi:HTH-type quorum sensing-dependent transcriptional regulator VjbR [compost metagenome]